MKAKFKVKKSLAKRIKLTGTGKWIRKRANTSHLAAHKTKRQKKRLDQTVVTCDVDRKRLKKLLGN